MTPAPLADPPRPRKSARPKSLLVPPTRHCPDFCHTSDFVQKFPASLVIQGSSGGICMTLCIGGGGFLVIHGGLRLGLYDRCWMPMLSFRADDVVAGQIDAVRGDLSRSEWVRRAVEAQLGVIQAGDELAPCLKPERPRMAIVGARKPPSVGGLHADDRSILGFLQGRRGSTERLIGQELEWPPMRVTKAVNRLANAGMVVFPSPGYVRIAEDG